MQCEGNNDGIIMTRLLSDTLWSEYGPAVLSEAEMGFGASPTERKYVLTFNIRP